VKNHKLGAGFFISRLLASKKRAPSCRYLGPGECAGRSRSGAIEEKPRPKSGAIIMPVVYLLHFEKPISPHHTTQHYLGYADDLHTRLAQHESGHGARLTQVALERGIGWTLARLWWGTRKTERQLKNRKEGPRLCPICHPDSYRNPALAKLDYF